MNITIKKQGTRNGAIFDCYADGQWILSRTHPENVFAWLAEYTAEHGPATITYTDDTERR